MAEETNELRERARRLFAICDKEEKGFVTKRDMQRMQGEMPLEPEQLEIVFDSLDMDQNGYLTFDEFIQGFGIYMESDLEECDMVDDVNGQKTRNESITEADEAEDDENFMELLDHLGGVDVFEDEKSVKELWDHFRQEGATTSFQFEKFLSTISDSIHNKEKEKETMEEHMRSQTEMREEEMRRLYEEMERQIEEEKELVIQMERAKELQLRNEMRDEIAKKDQLLAQLQSREKELQEALCRAQENEAASKHDLALLAKEKKALESQLEIQTRNVEETRKAIEQLRRESVNERRQRAMAAFSVAENIAVEREGLVQQLSMLRSINTKLTDESDLREYGSVSADITDGSASLAREMEDAEGQLRSPGRFSSELVEEDDSDIIVDDDSNFVLPDIDAIDITSKPTMTTTTEKNNSLFDELVSAVQLEPTAPWSQSTVDATMLDGPFNVSGKDDRQPKTANGEQNCVTSSAALLEGRSARRPSATSEERDYSEQQRTTRLSSIVRPDESAQPSFDGQARHSVTWSTNIQSRPPCQLSNSTNTKVFTISAPSIMPALPSAHATNILGGESIIGYHEGQWTHRVQLRKRESPVTPSTVFKIIVLGESGVGKTSFIRRFCCDDCDGATQCTVGIDLSVRCLPVGDGQQAALQFWDTAGKRNRQEKYRSISRQFIRKADGVIIMYDVTSEPSFLHVRHWIDCVQEVAGENVVCVLVGNKTDLLEQQQLDEETSDQDGQRRMMVTLTRHPLTVPTTTAMQLAQSMGLDFFETSAKTGYMVQQAMFAMAAKLRVQEKVAVEKAILLSHDDLTVEASLETATTPNEETSNLDRNAKKCCSL